MQDVDFELIFEPGKDKADPLDYLSRHPLPDTDTDIRPDHTEKFVKSISVAERLGALRRRRQITISYRGYTQDFPTEIYLRGHNVSIDPYFRGHTCMG